MLRTHVAVIKIFFILFIAILIGLFAFAIRHSILQTQASYIMREADYLRYKVELDYDIDKIDLDNLSLLVTKIFERPKSVVSATSTVSEALGIPILIYHGIVDEPDRFSLTKATFKDQMFALKKAGYDTVSLKDLAAFIKGEKKLPEKSFLLTFDDGRVDSYEGADPILRALDWTAVMFVATDQSFGKVDSSYYLDEKQVRNMIESGRWEIGSHAVQPIGGYIPVNEASDRGNLLSNRMWLKDESRLETEEEYKTRVRRELSESKRVIENLFGTEVIAFAYPFGDYGHQTINAEGLAENVVRQNVSENYGTAFRQTWNSDNYFTFNYTDEDIYRLKRIETPSDWSGEELLAFLESAGPKSLPYSDPLISNNGWKSTWGNLSFDESGLHLSPTPNNTGSFAFLDGTRRWTDYFYTVKADSGENDYISLYARYQSNDNYVSCTFGRNLVRIDEKVEGVSRTITETNQNTALPDQDRYGIRVEGGEVTCYEDTTPVVTASGVNEKLSSGGIGFRAWNELIGQSLLVFSDLNVEPIRDDEQVLQSGSVIGE